MQPEPNVGVSKTDLPISLVPGLGVADWNRLGPMRKVAIHEFLREGNTWQAARLNDLPETLRKV